MSTFQKLDQKYAYDQTKQLFWIGDHLSKFSCGFGPSKNWEDLNALLIHF